MKKLLTQSELTLAENAIKTLRTCLNGIHAGAVGDLAKQELSTLSSHLNSTTLSMAAVQAAVQYHPGAKMLNDEFLRLSNRAKSIMRDLSSGSSYRGPTRSTMSRTEKSQYISVNGAEAFFSLPV